MDWLQQAIAQGRQAAAARAQPRAVVDAPGWRQAGAHLAAGRGTLLSLWGEADAAHLCILADGAIGILTLACPTGRLPSIGSLHPPALRLERAMRDLCGLEAEAAPDRRPWLDHGRWGLQHPLGSQRPAAPAAAAPYHFYGAEGPPMHEIPVGPVHAGIIEPGHFRFTANGETIVRLEQRLGYVHKGIDHLLAGATLEAGAKVVGRVSGDSTVAYALAFAHAVETALELAPPARAVWLRALMAELERIANHLGDIGAICNDASFSLLHTHCGILREQVLRVAEHCFGHRLMMDRIVPGGVTADLRPDGHAAITALLATIRRHFPALVELYDSTASLQNRTVSTGILRPELAAQYGAGGFIGRASARAFDARKLPGYAPYPDLTFEVPIRQAGDVDARLWVRIEEVQQSLSLIEQILQRDRAGALRIDTPAHIADEGREALALIEGFRGDILAWVRLAPNGRLARCHLRDPSWLQWPLLEAAIAGNIVADFPLCNKSFNCSYSGHDL
jgi:Ni,Fe-hydrogenase III large subunit